MARVNILDCTLRDGGYVNNFAFSDAHILNIVKRLQTAGIDIIECGFLDAERGQSQDLSRFDSCLAINSLLARLPVAPGSLPVAMIEYGRFDVEDLPALTDTENEIKGIRLSFHKPDHLSIFDDAKTIIAKGYKLFIQPIATEQYADQELLNLIDRCKQLAIDSFYVVDTHGSMMRSDFRRIYYLLEHNLSPGTRLGFHSHNNLQLSYSNAIDFIELAQGSSREIIIDSSIYGMGRGAGNLNTELLADFINRRIDDRYQIEPLLDVVDEYLAAIHHETPWGYTLEHFLSASERCHPNYASYLINKKNLSIVEIKRLLASVSAEERREFNQPLIEDLYITYKEKMKLPLRDLPEEFYSASTLLVASGRSVEENKDHVAHAIEENGYQAVCLNHASTHVPWRYVFFSNQVRYDEFCDRVRTEELIVTSNIKVRSNHQSCHVVDYKQLFERGELKVDNSAILMLSLLASNDVSEVAVAGIDGYDVKEKDNYSYAEYNRVLDEDALEAINADLARAISSLSAELHITHVTPSRFRQHTKQRIVGVIPARYNSTRLPGKPLEDIAGTPMVIHVLRRAQKSKLLDEVIVATDDERILKVVEAHGGKAMMTDESHNNGSERMHEVARSVPGDIFVVINGDEALLEPSHIDAGVRGLLASDAPVSILYNRFWTKDSPADFKLVVNRRNEVMYISRNDIPSDAREEVEVMYKAYHVMSFTREFLEEYVTLEHTPLARIESHELLRVLENGYKLQGVEVESTAISVDTSEDLEYVRGVMASELAVEH